MRNLLPIAPRRVTNGDFAKTKIGYIIRLAPLASFFDGLGGSDRTIMDVREINGTSKTLLTPHRLYSIQPTF
ncbi:MAG TPA: hypothetical protein VK175_01100 [Leadbetterella sp.]|nr:hypothetical protein [Leadbetterella sp.]